MNKNLLFKSIKFGIKIGFIAGIVIVLLVTIYDSTNNSLSIWNTIIYLNYFIFPAIIISGITSSTLTFLLNFFSLNKFVYALLIILFFYLIETIIFRQGMNSTIGEYQDMWGDLIFIFVIIPQFVCLIWTYILGIYIYKNFRYVSSIS